MSGGALFYVYYTPVRPGCQLPPTTRPGAFLMHRRSAVRIPVDEIDLALAGDLFAPGSFDDSTRLYRPENALAAHIDDEDKGVTELMTPGGKQKMVIINVDPEDKNTVVNPDGNRGKPNMVIISESGLYSQARKRTGDLYK